MPDRTMSEEGKLKLSASRNKAKNSVQLSPSKKTQVVKLMEDAGVDFSKVETAIKQRNAFEIWLQDIKTPKLKEILELDKTLQMLVYFRDQHLFPKLQKGVHPSYKELKLAELIRKCTETSHKMKYGDKRVNVNATFIQDLRSAAMDEGESKEKVVEVKPE